jgi:drug/metabolite transporter (DMT)-like permease
VLKTLAFTALAMTAFAANSVLCRMALGQDMIDAASFTLIRLASGAMTLWLIVLVKNKSAAMTHGDWFSAGLLFLYAVMFSFAYITLSTGTGALILFGAVQLIMIFAGIRSGERPHARAWFGIALAMGGFIYLVSPGLSAPSPVGATLMAVAGIAWGLYSLQGRHSTNATATTMGNFMRAVPFALLISLLALMSFDLSMAGALLAVSSGAIASGIGYVIWYAALPGLAATHGATVQLSVPVLAALGGVMFLSESLTLRLLMASMAILLGVGIVLWSPVHSHRRPTTLGRVVR